MIQVMFVDDDPSILSGLRRMLHSKRQSWNMRFIEGSLAALEQLEAEPADVVVSDMRMPNMDGAAFLAQVRQRYPHTARIALSGFSDSEMTMRCLSVAHQYLNKPCEPERLHYTVERSHSLVQRLGRNEITTLVTQLGSLSSPPAVISALNSVLLDPESSFVQVADVVGSDSALTAKVLQLVNSAFFGVTTEITTVNDAVSYLGLATVRNIAAMSELFRIADDDSKGALEEIAQLQAHSRAVAELAQELIADSESREDAFVAGMLHEVGTLALLSVRPDSVEEPADGTADVVFRAELGAALLDLWGLPSSITEAVLCHRDPLDLSQGIGLTQAVAIAEQVVTEKTWDPSLPREAISAITKWQQEN